MAAALGVEMVLPVRPLAPWLGFVPLPPLFVAFLLGMTAAYRAAIELAKRRFYRGATV